MGSPPVNFLNSDVDLMRRLSISEQMFAHFPKSFADANLFSPNACISMADTLSSPRNFVMRSKYVLFPLPPPPMRMTTL